MSDTKQQDGQQSLPGILAKFVGAPTAEMIEQWKMDHGDVYVSGFSETELFVFRAITRPEWVNLQKLSVDPESKMDQFKFEEAICDACVLWKSIKGDWSTGKAGIPSALQEQILQNSCFMTPAAVSMLVAKL